MNSPQEARRKNALTAIFTVIALIYVFPVILVVINSFKASSYVTSETFRLPTKESFMGWGNFVKGMTFGNYPFAKSVFFSFFLGIFIRFFYSFQ